MAAGAARNRIFISCVTKEFSDLRSALRSYLSRADCDVKVQEDFCQTPEDTIEKLDAYIRTCAAVIHLVGQASGASAHPVAVRTYLAGFDAAQPFLGRSPELRAALGDFSGLSYTQWEAFIAMHHGIRPFVYQTDGPYGGYAATDAEKTNQSQHVERLRLGRRYPEVFAGEQDLFGKLIGDLRKILPATAGHQPFNLPGSIGTLFKGREDFLGKLHDTLEAATADTGTNGAHAAPRGVAAISTPRAIHGLGGVGKTRTAIEYGHRFRGEYSALLLVRADTPESLRLNLAELTGPLVLDLPAATAPDQEAQLAAAIHWLEEHPRWFLILDNVDNEDSAREVESLLGRLRGGHIVITTRLGNWSGQVEALDLDVLGEEAAVEFLLARTAGRRPTTPTDAADVRTLARELDNLALALEQAGAYIHERRMSFAAYLRRWQESRSAVLIWFNERAMQYPASVAVTWATTFEQLGASARALLEMLAFLSSAPIPRALLETDESPVILAVAELGPEARELPSGEAPSAFAMEDALAELANYSLVRYLDEPPVSFSMHRLVQEIVRSRLEEAARTGRWGQTVRLASAYAPRGGYDISTWSRWAELAPHLETLFKKAREQGDPEPIPNLLNGFAGFLQYCSAAYSTAEPLYRRALKALERVLGAEHQDTLTSVHNLAGLLHAKGDYAGAESLSRRALQMREKVLGAEHPDTLGSVNALASLLQAKGDYASAEPLLRRALEVGERLLGAEHPFTLASINNLAGLLAARGDNAIAETLYRRVLEASERLMGAEHPDTLTCVNNLANVLQARWDCAAAETLYRRALETRERMLGPEHPRTLVSINGLAVLLDLKGDLAGAEPLYRRAFETWKRVLGPEHPNTLESAVKFANLLRDKGDYSAAESLYRQTLEAHERVLGPEHPGTSHCVDHLGSLLFSKGEMAEAETLCRRSLDARERVLGAHHPDTLTNLVNLAALLRNKGDYAGAEPLCHRALETLESLLGAEHPVTLGCIAHLAGLFHAKGDYGEAETLCRRTLEARERVLGSEHPDTLESVAYLGGFLRDKGDLPEAEGLLRRALEGFERVFGVEHPSSKIARENWEACRECLET